MAVQEDLRRLSQMQAIYLGWGLFAGPTVWHEGRLQQTNDGGWIFRSSSRDGTIVAFQLGYLQANWVSGETPTEGLFVQWSIQHGAIQIGPVYLRQQLPQEVTN